MKNIKIEVDNSVYDLISYLKLLKKLNFILNDKIGIVVDAKKAWSENYKLFTAAYAVSVFRSERGNLFHAKLVFINNKWSVLDERSSGIDNVEKNILCYDVNNAIPWIEKIITTNPTEIEEISKCKEIISELQNNLKTAQDKLKELGG